MMLIDSAAAAVIRCFGHHKAEIHNGRVFVRDERERGGVGA